MLSSTPIRTQAAQFVFGNRRPDLSLEEFSAHWTNKYGPLVTSFDAMKENVGRYEQTLVDQQKSEELKATMGVSIAPYDGVAIQGAESYERFMALWADKEAVVKVTEDHKNFASSDFALFLGRLHTLIEKPESSEKGVLRKDRVRIVTLWKRRPDLSPEEFQKYWLGNHIQLAVETAPELTDNILRYEQFHTDYAASEEAAKNLGMTFLPFDGIMIQESENYDNLFKIWTDPKYAAIVEDAKNFMDTAGTLILPGRCVTFI